MGARQQRRAWVVDFGHASIAASAKNRERITGEAVRREERMKWQSR
jgi:hypothetical protein